MQKVLEDQKMVISAYKKGRMDVMVIVQKTILKLEAGLGRPATRDEVVGLLDKVVEEFRDGENAE